MDDGESGFEVSDDEVDEAIERIDDPSTREWFIKDRHGQTQGRELLRLFLSMSDEGKARTLRSARRISSLPREMRAQMTNAEFQQYLNNDSEDTLN